ncbi:MAG: threonine/serine exporter family protein [Anaerolineaceae bacterium]|nr:MAG: threonine/serine exporter family protein [Anaerolineaceae bacterium]
MPKIVFTVSGVVPMFPGIFAYTAMLDILQITGIINIGTVGPIDLAILQGVIPNLFMTAFMLAALALELRAYATVPPAQPGGLAGV